MKMRMVRSTWKTYGKITMILGACFLAVSLILLMVWLFTEGFVASLLAIIFSCNGAVWLMLGTICSLRARYERKKLQRLKNTGLRFDAKVERIVRNVYYMRMSSYISGYAECSYQDREGKSNLVRSPSFIIDEHNPDYLAAVYVNGGDRRDCAAELSVKTASGEYDYDYRRRT